MDKNGNRRITPAARRTGVIALLFALTILMTACGGPTVNSAYVEMQTLSETMLAAFNDAGGSAVPMATVTDESDSPETLLATVTDMDYEDVDHFFISYSTEGKADEIVVLCLTDPDKAKDAEASLLAHKENRAALFRTYGPDQADRIENNGIVFSQDQYAVLIICDGSESVKEAFEKAVEIAE